jgi:hypothetical protein
LGTEDVQWLASKVDSSYFFQSLKAKNPVTWASYGSHPTYTTAQNCERSNKTTNDDKTADFTYRVFGSAITVNTSGFGFL